MMPRFSVLLLIRLLAIASVQVLLYPSVALAERADRDKPVHIEFQTTELGDRDKTTIFKGNVRLTQGNLEISCDRLVIAEDAGGYYHGVATPKVGELAKFKDKLEGKNEQVYGEAERIEFDTRQDKIRLFERAYVKKGTDEVRGRYIERDGYAETFKATNGPAGTSTQGAPQAEVILQPRTKPVTKP
jgi:lipopolysaccharide export system protein LptA